MPQNFLNVKKLVGTALDEDMRVRLPIMDVEAEGGKAIPGITVHGQFPGMVPPFEEVSAMLEAKYKLREWQELHYSERAIFVAYFRIKKRLESEEQEASK